MNVSRTAIAPTRHGGRLLGAPGQLPGPAHSPSDRSPALTEFVKTAGTLWPRLAAVRRGPAERRIEIPRPAMGDAQVHAGRSVWYRRLDREFVPNRRQDFLPSAL